jgi:hypothetical protein
VLQKLPWEEPRLSKEGEHAVKTIPQRKPVFQKLPWRINNCSIQTTFRKLKKMGCSLTQSLRLALLFTNPKPGQENYRPESPVRQAARSLNNMPAKQINNTKSRSK